MDVRAQGANKGRPRKARGSTSALRWPRPGHGADSQWIGQLLGEWQAKEIRLASCFAECRGLSPEQLEDIYQETNVALLTRPYQTEEHLRNALRVGIKQRALNVHRDEGRRARILARSAPGMHALAEAGACEDAPELAAIAEQDRLIVSEFMAELTPKEQLIFRGMAEGMRYRALAPVLEMPINQARNASRAVERKRERFQLLYDTGRLCGYRSATISALISGQATTEQLKERAFAHLDGCMHCRAEHKTNAARLRQRFQGQATALLPMPALAAHMGWLARADARLRTWLDRFLAGGAPSGIGGPRESAIALLAGGGVGAKAAATAVTVAVLAGGTTASVVIDHNTHHRRVAGKHKHARALRQLAPSPPSSDPIISARAASPAAAYGASLRHSASGEAGAHSWHGQSSGSAKRHEPGGFAFLGVARMASSSSRPARARIASNGAGPSPRSGGGEFGP